MKAKDIEVPFDWDDRKIMIHDRVWYIPGLLKTPQSFDFPGWDSPQLFGNNNPIAIEYCSGNGDWIADRAKRFPHINWLAIEIKYQRVRKIWAKIKNHQLSNLVVICGEAFSATRNYFPDSTIEEVYINFPDPWPKNRHAKNRIIQAEFLNELARILKVGGAVTFVTDDPNYSDWTTNIFQRLPIFESSYAAPYYISEMDGYGTSYFEDLWRQKGKSIRYHHYVKKGPLHAQTG